MRAIRLAFALLIAGLPAACAVSSGPPTAAALAEGRQRSAQVLSELQRQDALIQDRALVSYMQQIVNRFSGARPPGLPPVRPYIVRDADINAFTLGGDTIFINAGLIAAMENEAQLAMVIAHEIGHIDRGHIVGRQQTAMGAQLLGIAAAIGLSAAGVTGDVAGLGGELVATGTMNTYTRSQERDADVVGARYLSAGGYSVLEGARSFEVLSRVYGQRGGPAAIIFSSHPMSSERQANLRALAAGETGGRVAQRTYLQRTNSLRRDVLGFLEANGRNAEAAQLRRNLAALR